MFKLVVLSAVLVAVAAEPGVLFSAPYTSFSSVIAPATTTITKSASSVVHPSPVVYSAPLAYSHFIKKRSPGVLAYNYAPTTYLGSFSYTTPLLSTPVLSTRVISPAIVSATPITAHLIKKRSAPLLVTPTTYATSPLYASTYAAAPVISTPLIHSTHLISTPLTYSTHFIKKRSAPLLTTYVAPTSFSQQSRVDITHGVPTLKLASYPSTFISQPYFY